MRSGEGLRPLAPLAILPVGGPAGLPAMLPECGQDRQMTTFSSCSASSGTVRGLDPFTLLNPYSHGIFVACTATGLHRAGHLGCHLPARSWEYGSKPAAGAGGQEEKGTGRWDESGGW